VTGRTGTSEAFRGAHRQPMSRTCLELAIREAHLGQRSPIRAQKAGHMSASDPIKIYRNPLREFKSARSAQRFLGLHAAAYNTFNLQRHLISRSTLRIFRLSVVRVFGTTGWVN